MVGIEAGIGERLEAPIEDHAPRTAGDRYGGGVKAVSTTSEKLLRVGVE